MKKMRYLCLFCVAMLLCGCQKIADFSADFRHQEANYAQIYTQAFAADVPAPSADHPEIFGSVGHISGRQVFVSVFVEDISSHWSEEEKSTVLPRMHTAVDFLRLECAKYSVYPDILYDWQLYPELIHTFTYSGNVESKGDDYDLLRAELQEWIESEAAFSLNALKEKYHADGIGILIHVNKSGVSYAGIHYSGYEQKEYTEMACIFNYYEEDIYPEVPGTIAHEMLHLYGARDLYTPSEEDGIDQAMVDYVERYYPQEIMFHVVYAPEGPHQHNTITPITAYYLGLIDDIPETKRFPQAASPVGGAFIVTDEG